MRLMTAHTSVGTLKLRLTLLFLIEKGKANSRSSIVVYLPVLSFLATRSQVALRKVWLKPLTAVVERYLILSYVFTSISGSFEAAVNTFTKLFLEPHSRLLED
jgi:hypothetical protein